MTDDRDRVRSVIERALANAPTPIDLRTRAVRAATKSQGERARIRSPRLGTLVASFLALVIVTTLVFVANAQRPQSRAKVALPTPVQSPTATSPRPSPNLPSSATPGTPLPRIDAAFAWDQKDGYLLMFGGMQGDPGDTVFGDTWAWVGDRWMQLHPPTSPPARSGGALGYDPVGQRTVLYGGGGNFYFQRIDPQRNDTWAWDGTTWTPLFPAHLPTAAVCCQVGHIAYDEATSTLWLTEGLLKMWAWSGSDWVLASPTARPPERLEFGLAYVASLQGVVAVCGYGGEGTPLPGESAASHDDTWLWKGGQWAELHPPSKPARGPCIAAFDAGHSELVVFSLAGTTWIFDGNTWVQQHPLHSPPTSQGGSSMAYDLTSHRVVLFGGMVGCPCPITQPYLNQTWTWGGTDWSRQT